MRHASPSLAAIVLLAAVAGALPALSSPAAASAGTGASAQAACSFPVTDVDATGTEVTVDAEPERVVTLAPSAAQTLWEIGAREKVVGVTQYAGYLDGADARTNVSGAGRSLVSVETVVGLEPDLVLAPNVVANETVSRLRTAGVTVYRFPPASAIGGEDPTRRVTVSEKTRLIGRLVGACEGADAAVAAVESELSTVERAVEGEDRPRVLYVFFGFTAGEGTFVDEIITLAGGRNVAAAANVSGFERISAETVVARDPEWIVLNSDAPTVPRTEAYNSTTAVREGNTVVLDANYVSQPAPRVVRPVRKLARALHPEAYAAANATDATTPSATATPTLTPTDPHSPSPTPSPSTTPTPAVNEGGGTDGAAPGFGVALAVVAVALAGLVADRGRR